MTGEPSRLLPEVDHLMDRENAAMGTVATAYQGGDPLRDPPAFGPAHFTETEIDRQMPLRKELTRNLNEQVFGNPESGWGEFTSFMDGIFQRYRDQNQSDLIKQPKTEEEWIAQAQQNRPVEVDPNEMANMRHMVVTRLIPAMKAADPGFDFWSDPRTKGYAQWLNREAGPGQPGYFTSGDQPVEMGVVGRAAYTAWQGIEGVGDATTALVHGGWDMGRQAIQALGGPDIGPSYPTNYIEGPDGKLYDNGGKAPSMMDGLVMAWAAATGDNVEKAAARAGRAQEWELANREGFGGIITSVSRLGGELAGMAPGFGATAAVGRATMGSLTTKGLQALGSLRLTKGVTESERAVKIIRAMSAKIGEGAGMAAYEAGTQGRVQGYGAAYLHGLVMAPVLMSLGAMGRKAEWYAANRMNMPGKVAHGVAGALEGAGFAGVETLAPELLPSAWGFIRDPNQSTFEAYAKNMLAFGLLKMGTGRTTVQDPATMQIRRGIGRAQFAEKLARGEVPPEAVADAPVANEGKLRELGDLSMRSREGRSLEERGEALKRQRELEAELDAEEAGKGPAEKSVAEHLANREAERLQRQSKLPTREEIQAVREMPEGPEKRQATIDMLQGARKEFGKEAANFIKKQVEAEEVGQRAQKAQADEILSGSDTVKAMMDKTGQKASDFKAERDKQLREQGIEPTDLAVEEGHGIGDKGKGKEADKGEMSEEDAEVASMAKMMGVSEAEARAELGLPPKAGESPEQLAAEKAAREERYRQEYEHLRIKPGENVPRETPMASAKGLTEFEAKAGMQSHSGERAGPQSLQLPPTRQVEPTEGTKQVSAADIYSEAQGRPGKKGFRIPFTQKRIGATQGDVVQVAIRGGKMQGRNVAGIFKFFENMLRTKEGRDLAVLSHEWSHAMHRHTLGDAGKGYLGLAEKQIKAAVARDPRIVAEMDVMLKDYPGSEKMGLVQKWAETWAEWHARNLLGEVGLDAKMPAISKWMREWLSAPAQARLREGQYGRLQEMLYRYNAQGSEARVEESSVRGTAPPTETQKATKPGWFTRAKQAINSAMMDDMAKLKASQDRWLKAAGRKPEDVSIIEDPARLQDAIAMTASKTNEYFTRKGIQLDDKFVPGLEPIMKSLAGKERDFEKYVVSLRNMELYERGKDTQLPPQDYTHTIKAIAERHPDIPEAVTRLKAWTDALLDYVAQSGNMDAETLQRIKDSHAVYVPFFRAIEGPRQHGAGRGVAEKGTGMSRIKGSTYEIKDPLVALQQVSLSLITKAHQNQVMTALYKHALMHESGGLATIVPKTVIPKDHPIRELLDKIEQKVELPGDKQHELESVFEALREADALNPETITLFSQKIIPTGERSIVAYTPRLSEAEIADMVSKGAPEKTLREANNKLQWLEMDAEAYETLMGLDKMPMIPERAQPIFNLLRAPGQLVRLFATGVSPSFAAANLYRDAMVAPLFDRQGNIRPLGGFIDLVKGAAAYHSQGRIRELYDELGVRTASFWTEGRQRALIGERQSIWRKTKRVIEGFEDLISTPENYIRMNSFKNAYEGAKAEGKSEFESRMLALEAGKEITVNFARAGWLARAYNQYTPYFTAGIAGQRKLWGNLLVGGADSKTDAQRARIQRGTIINGLVNITLPAMFFWWLHKDEEWYQDLPEWRKLGYTSTKIGDTIASVPLPFEAGVLFGGIPMMLADQANDGNPASAKEALKGLAGPYAQVGSLIPAFIKPIIEVSMNKNIFTGRPLTPEWISRSDPSEEQATFYTSESAKIMSRAMRGILSPIEIEQLMGGYTAGAAVTALQVIDEITQMKDHPGLAANPFRRFTKQQPHGQSDYVDKLYALGAKMEQNEDSLSPQDRNLKLRIERTKKQISALRKSYQSGEMDRAEAERRSYELAQPLVEESNRSQ